MHDSSVTTEPLVDPVDAPLPTTEAERGVSRRGLLGRAGVVGAGAALATTGIGAATAAAATTTDPTAASTTLLPKASAVRARLRDVPLVDLEINELAALLQAGDITSVELTNAYLDRIDRYNGDFEVYMDNDGYNAFVRVDRSKALAEARAADERLAAARSGGPAVSPLCGVPIGVKDSIGLEGRPAQNGAYAFKGNVGTADGPAMAKLRAAGVVFLGHTICSAFSGSITGTFAGNAWNKDYFPGGSSQGSGVAPIARLSAAAIGEETGGSIIFPSSANGASGIKPSLGLVSSAGVMPLTPGHDVIGPISRSMRDSALLLNEMMGPDPENDQQTLSAPLPLAPIPAAPRGGPKPLAGITIGVPQTDWLTGTGGAGTSPQALYAADNLAVFNRVRSELQALGARVIDFPGLDMRDATLNTYFSSADVLERVDGANVSPSSAVRYSNLYEIGYADAVRQFAAGRLQSQADKLLAQYGRTANGETTFENATRLYGGVSSGARREGERRRRQTAANYAAALDAFDVDFMLVMNFGTKITKRGASTTGLRYRTYYQVPNALGWPMISFPAGFGTDADGLPISVQFWGTRFSDGEIVQAAIDYQAAYPQYHRTLPPDPAIAVDPRRKRLTQEQVDAVEVDPDPLLSNDPDVHEAGLPAEYRPR
ncbi:amidase [Patulibacter brassicae]|uniref:Amidase n=1 Tax=Patulibacter brassicae TaxID=1705717 RepID=A0ABU4VNF1_9ACTN|nr:amidase [Patulibacter brassicae]MDX8153353.1 amidase [Patulibacter brassicae]